MPAAPGRALRGFYAIIDPYPDPSLSFAEIVRAFVRAGCPIIQLRMKGMEERDARKVAGEIRPREAAHAGSRRRHAPGE